MIMTKTIHLESQGNGDIIDITPEVEEYLVQAKVKSGTVTVFVSGSTAGITTMEHEPGLIADFKAVWESIAPKDKIYKHDQRWGDGNGYSHVRASLLGASICVPFDDKKLLLGTWQQIVLVDFDNRPRSREVVVQIAGE